MSFGIQIFGDNDNRVLDSNYRSYRLLDSDTNVLLSSSLTYTVTSEVPPLAFIRTHTEGVCVIPPIYEHIGGGVWEVTLALGVHKTVPWAVPGTLAPISWGGNFPADSDQAFPNPNSLLITNASKRVDVYIFGVQAETGSTFGAAMFDDTGNNPFMLTEKPLVVVKATYLDPRSWSYSGGTSLPDYGAGNTLSYIDYSKVTPDGNYSKIAALPNSISAGRAAISPGSLVLTSVPNAKRTWSSMLSHVFRFVSGHFIIGPDTGVAIMDRKITTWTGNFWRVRNETASNDPLIDYVSVLVIDVDMYI